MVARWPKPHARLLHGGRWRGPPLLALPRWPLWRRRTLVRARGLRVTPYLELAVTTNFSFLRGASHAEELVEQAAKLGLAGIGVADRNSFGGVVRAHIAAKDTNLKFSVGVRLVTTDGFEALAYPMDRAAYGRLCRLLTRGKRKAEKGECDISFEDLLEFSEGQIFIVLPPSDLKRTGKLLPSPLRGR